VVGSINAVALELFDARLKGAEPSLPRQCQCTVDKVRTIIAEHMDSIYLPTFDPLGDLVLDEESTHVASVSGDRADDSNIRAARADTFLSVVLRPKMRA
jgi:hypothetical protein